MSTPPPEPKAPVFTPASKALKKKVGDGGIPAHILKKAQDYLDSNPVDFTPYAAHYLEQLVDARNAITKGDMDAEAGLKKIVDTVMQMKSNGSMFHYQLVSMISDVMLRFMEHVKAVDKDFIDILNVYLKVLEIVINKKITGNGGREGYALTQELHYACERYYSKNGIEI